jgi:hypothetical protein
MLKITTKTEAMKAILELEGRLAGAWVDELEQCWREIPPGYAVTVALKAVSFIDDKGKKLLSRLHEGGAELQASGCMTTCIVQQITGAKQRKPREEECI